MDCSFHVSKRCPGLPPQSVNIAEVRVSRAGERIDLEGFPECLNSFIIGSLVIIDGPEVRLKNCLVSVPLRPFFKLLDRLSKLALLGKVQAHEVVKTGLPVIETNL